MTNEWYITGYYGLILIRYNEKKTYVRKCFSQHSASVSCRFVSRYSDYYKRLTKMYIVKYSSLAHIIALSQSISVQPLQKTNKIYLKHEVGTERR